MRMNKINIFHIQKLIHMKVKRLDFFITILMVFGISGLQAQISLPAAGGNVSGSGGSLSYTLGQVVYVPISDASGNSIEPGIQQAYELFIVSANENDLKIDTYRASGAGGQHVNKTDSAVRITHLPTGVVVQCQNQRSQHNNKSVAMKILTSKLIELKEEAKAEKIEELGGEHKEIAWGSQIRSYVLHPYNMIKDHRTGHEEGNTQKVMDGYLDEFIESYLKYATKNSADRKGE